jgi:hypothetical protein
MRLRDVAGMSEVLAGTELGNDPVWSREEDRLSGTDIQLFYARNGLKGQKQAAIDLIDQAQAVVIRALFAGDLPKGAFSALVLHETPPAPYMADEFVEGLVRLRPSRRGACIFALENHMPPAQVTELFWTQLDLASLSKASLEVIRAQRVMRHIRLPYVFWEWATPSIASPLLVLKPTIEEAFAIPMVELQERYDRMVLIDRRADALSFMALVKAVDRG